LTRRGSNRSCDEGGELGRCRGRHHQAFGKLDVLVNNADISSSAEQDFYSTEAWHRITAVNATGVAAGRSSICRRLPASAASTFTWPTTPRRRRYD